ncbi:hypothetical protein TRFO_26940 [Tritrichomonas foetus]|uniref:Uncharacterized protein n=1 Tax=Tritrichomonas foetus TaxID=1144522 RepID=A0A1J4K1Q3_9EUKA|nr:hypothetical protein TRFO_26940 [Tritrichomonas foetus]|eukprot:OHT05319.1 hypothetical protein TRFO_26940 [Tritrichomonas foetus]
MIQLIECLHIKSFLQLKFQGLDHVQNLPSWVDIGQRKNVLGKSARLPCRARFREMQKKSPISSQIQHYLQKMTQHLKRKRKSFYIQGHPNLQNRKLLKKNTRIFGRHQKKFQKIIQSLDQSQRLRKVIQHQTWHTIQQPL